MTELATRDTRLLAGSIPRGVFSLAWPLAMQMVLHAALGITDFYFVGWLGAEQQDALTSSLIVIWTLFSLSILITVGLNAIVARHYGADDLPRAAATAGQGLKLAIVSSLFFGVMGYFSREFILIFMDAEPAVVGYGASYLRYIFMASPFLFVSETCAAIFRASGDTKRPMLVSVTAVTLNIILDPILIFGWGPAPELGVAGASLGTFLTLIVEVIIYIYFISRGYLSFSVQGLWRDRFERSVCLNILRISLPIATQSLVFLGVYTILLQIVHRFGHISGAAMGIGNRLESINYHICSALAMAASAMVGQNLGAKLKERASRTAWTATGIGVAFTGVTTALLLLMPEQLARLFTDDADVISAARDYLVIVGLSQIFMAIEIIIDGAFSGAGDTLPPMVVSVPGSLARVPVAYVLAVNMGYGVAGVWWAISITTIVRASIMAYWFSRNAWQRKEV